MRNAETRHFFQAASAGASPPAPASPFARLPVVHVTSWWCSAPADPAIDLCWLGDRLCPPAQRELPGNRRQRRQRERDSATREEDGACHGAARHGGTGLSWKRRGRRGRAGAQILQRGSAPPQGHRWSSLSLPSMKTHQKSVYGVRLAMPPLPRSDEGSLAEGPGSRARLGCVPWAHRGDGTRAAKAQMRWSREHLHVSGPSLQHPCSAQPDLPGHPGDPLFYRGVLWVPEHSLCGQEPTSPAPLRAGHPALPSLCFIHHQLRPFATQTQRSGIPTLPSLAFQHTPAALNPSEHPL